jgi:tetratricopeptide (TPR) repeat protein
LKVRNFVRTKRNIARSFALLAISLLLDGVAMKQANAEVIDRIEINQVGDKAEIQIKFVTRIQYLRQASLKNGDVRLYFDLLEIDASDPHLTSETRESPPSDIAPHFTITYPELDSSLNISFGKMVDYQVRPGNDGRSISIFTPVINPKSEPRSGAAPAAVIDAIPLAIVFPLTVPSATAPSATVPGGSVALPSVASEAAPPAVPPQPEAGGAPPMVQRTQQDIEVEAKQFTDNARDAIQHEQLETAIETLNRLLLLPPNQQSQSAQELIGEAREKNGEIAKARAEYELYLELYPNAADIQQVKERLAHLPVAATKPVQAEPSVTKQKFVEEKMTVYGGISQYYYKGVSHTDAFSIASDLTTTASSLTGTDQSQLLSLLDLTARKRTDTTDTRIVLRDNYNANFLPGQRSDNRFNDVYVEQSARDRSYLYRMGRQTGSAGGAPGRFDGALLGYSLNPAWRVNGVIGTPVEFISGGGSVGESKTFTGVSFDFTRLPEQWSSSSYFIQQRVGGFVDRRAIGVETHYFDMRRNYMGLFEYDTIFKKVNLGMFQGNWTTETSTNYNLLLDRRRSPPLQLTNALMGQPVQSIAAMLQSGASLSTLRADSQALSPISNLFAIGMDRPYSPRLRIGGDFRINNMSGTGATTGVTTGVTSTGQPATQGSGNIYTYSFQALGNNLLFENDLGVVNAAYTSAKTYKGQSLTFTQVETLRRNWRVDMLLQLYNQNDNFGTHQTQIRPSLKLNYRLNNSVNLEGEGGLEAIHTSSATQNDKTRRTYFYVGYRWDFQ